LAGYIGKQVTLRYDPDNLGVIYIYRYHQNQEIFLSRGFPLITGLSNRSLKEWKKAKEALKQNHKNFTSENVANYFETEEQAPQKTMGQRRKAAQKANKQVLPTIKKDLEEEFDAKDTENPLLNLEPAYEDDLFE
jgi:hypothetical protein